MSSRALRKELRRRRHELRARLRLARREHERRLAALPALRRARRRRLLRRLGVVATVALLASFARCSCAGPVEPPPAPAAEPVKLEAKKVTPTLPPPARLGGKLDKMRRADFVTAPPAGHSWLDDFRLQVAARSPRLAECFQGAQRPGALRWTAAVTPESGVVSQHELEPIGLTDDIGKAQRACLVAALSEPVYRLRLSPEEAARSTPTRVGMVIEF